MDDTGRIKKALHPLISDLLFTRAQFEDLQQELKLMVQVDKAHLLMLEKQQLLQGQTVRALLKAITELENHDFAPLQERIPTRGLYLLYEDFLIETLGMDIGGMLQLGRSRNDLNATVFQLKMRLTLQQAIQELFALLEVLLQKALQYSETSMPAFTHYQPAVPVTYGHYLLGIAHSLARDGRHLLKLIEDIDVCPLGAGAVGGTSVPIDAGFTARLLGFSSGVSNSVDAVASRDVLLRLLSELNISGLLLSRVATDMLFWTSPAWGLLTIPDELAGSSSVMPNKRNAFILENVQGKTGLIAGAYMGALTAMHKTPFTNSIAVGTEATSFTRQAITAFTDSAKLMTLFVNHAIPDVANMTRAMEGGYTMATDLANALVIQGMASFRDAHRIVGGLVWDAANNGRSLDVVFLEWKEAHGVNLDFDPDAGNAVGRTNEGGGPGRETFGKSYALCSEQLDKLKREWQNATARWSEASSQLVSRVNRSILTKAL